MVATIQGSHKVEYTPSGDKVIIRDLELFVGYIPSIDSDTDDGVRKYTAAKVDDVFNRTSTMMAAGQNPKIVVLHDQDGQSAPEEAVGDVIKITRKEINGGPGIAGDVEMSIRDFNELLKSNKYPRRSAEIWSDGFMSEVALLGRDTPRRPLPDTKFQRTGMTREVFSRAWPLDRFAEPAPAAHGPGPGNVFIPKESDMDDMTKLKNELDETKKRLEECMSRLAKYEKDDADGKDVASRMNAIERERDDFKRAAESQANELSKLRSDLTRERFTRKVDELVSQGYRVGDKGKLLDRLCKASDADAELDFCKSLMARDPIGLVINQNGAEIGGSSYKSAEADKAAAERARDRAVAEGKPESFSRYYAEELAKV